MYTETAQSEGDRDAFLYVGMEKKQRKGGWILKKREE